MVVNEISITKKKPHTLRWGDRKSAGGEIPMVKDPGCTHVKDF